MKLILMIFYLTSINSSLSNLRILYQEASIDENKLNQLMALAQKNSSKGHLYKGYYGAGKIILAKFAFNPYRKYNLFIEGKGILESAITSDVNNIELRYLRLTIQMNAPSVLGYSSNIISDKAYLTKHINDLNDTELQHIIKNYLNSIQQ